MFRDTFAELGPAGGPTLADILFEVVTQFGNETSSKALSAAVKPKGRYVARASGADRAPRKEKVVEVPDALVGDKVFVRPNGADYHARDWGMHSDVMALRKAREATIKCVTENIGSPMFVLAYGAPGCGKTALVEAAFGSEVVTLMGTGDTEVADLMGGYVQTPGGGFDWVDGGLVKAAEEGLVYFIDEIGLIDPKVLSVVYGLMDGRRELVITANPERGVVKAHPNFFVVAATNPNAPGVRLSEALLSRFTVQVELTTDWNLARKLGVSSTLVTAAQNLAKKVASGEVGWAPQMRELLAFRDVSAVYGEDWAIANLVAASPELDRPVVVDVLTRAFGREAKAAKI